MKEWVLQKKSAFLLIEQLMALAIFAVSFLLISGVYQVLMKVQSKLEVPNYIEWHLMVTQMDTHLQGYARPPVVFEHKFEDGRPTKEESYVVIPSLPHIFQRRKEKRLSSIINRIRRIAYAR